MADPTVGEIAALIRQAAPDHYMCDSGFGCEACTYEDIANLLDPAVTCTCTWWRQPQAVNGNINNVPHHTDCKANRGGIAP